MTDIWEGRKAIHWLKMGIVSLVTTKCTG